MTKEIKLEVDSEHAMRERERELTVRFNLGWGKTCHVTGKPSAGQYSMDPGDSENVYGNPRLLSLNFTLKIQG